MRLNELIADDAVSPVIGVILMVAITVILAAVVASSVLGLSSQARRDTPQASFSFDYEEGPLDDGRGLLGITHESGEAIPRGELYLRGDGFTDVSGELSGQDMSAAGAWQGSASGADSEIVSGDSVDVGLVADYEIDVVYQATDGETSTTLASDAGPAA